MKNTLTIILMVIGGAFLTSCSHDGFDAVNSASTAQDQIQSLSSPPSQVGADFGTILGGGAISSNGNSHSECNFTGVTRQAECLYSAIGRSLATVSQDELNYWNAQIAQYGYAAALATAQSYVAVATAQLGQDSVAYINGAGSASAVESAKNVISGFGIICSLAVQACSQAMGATIQEEIHGLYISIFGRSADSAGYQYWLSIVTNQSSSANARSQIAGSVQQLLGQAFAANSAFASRYDSLSDSQFVDQLYRNIAGSSGDPNGEQYWINRIWTLKGSLSDRDARGAIAAELVNATISWNSTQQGSLSSAVYAAGISARRFFITEL